MSDNTTSSEYLTVEDVLEYLGISRTTLWKLRKEGKLTTYMIGERAIRFKQKEVQQLVDDGAVTVEVSAS